VRRRISERVQSMTGLQITELNATVNDIVFPEGGPRRRTALSTSDANAETRTLPGSEEPGEDETAELRSEDVEEARHTLVDDETQGSGRSEEGRA
jgi:hypothetical protein